MVEKQRYLTIFAVLVLLAVVMCYAVSKVEVHNGFKLAWLSLSTAPVTGPDHCSTGVCLVTTRPSPSDTNVTVKTFASKSTPARTPVVHSYCMGEAMDRVTEMLLMAGKVTSRSVFTDHSRNLTIYGRVRGGHQYGVYGSSIGNPTALKYLFLMPLSALAWNRIGFGSIVTLVGDQQSCEKVDLMAYMVSKLLAANATVILVAVDRSNTVMMSQTSRIFAASLVNEAVVDNRESWNETYFITSDCDIWPFKRSAYVLRREKAIHALNGKCCGHFRHKDKRYRMLPMTNLGMNQSTWISALSRYNGGAPTSPREILDYFIREFGSIVTEPVKKGSNFGWFMDQRMLSVVVFDWLEQKGKIGLMDYGKGQGGKRIKQGHWKNATIEGCIGAHVVQWAYLPKNWNLVLPVLKELYDEATVKWCYDFLMYFRTTFTSKKTYRTPTNKV